ncbi:site-specific integrase [uncultured Sneathiella sp.]|uniref:tyrosine-type recombinase/integrase n=1 Tax=uncultured Sneathiella sp. TaxID=879315 RepID=UPI0030DB440F|tara:strand:+ start:98 stop:1087 length:990 start_codon:yes stop_codon:yes gene_type:complete
MATIRKRGNRWQAQVRRREHPPISKTFNVKSDAARWARTVEIAIDRGEILSHLNSPQTIETLADLMVQYRDRVTTKKRGSKVETLRINKFLSHPLCKTKVKFVTPYLIAAYRDERLRAVKGETVRRDLTILSHAFNIAIREWGLPILNNPVSKIEKPKPAKGRERRISKEELDALLRGCEQGRNKYLRYAIQLAVLTGMRRGELLKMKWEHLDRKKNLLLLPTTKNGYSRVIPLCGNAIKVLNIIGVREEGFVLDVSENALRLSWERLRNRVGIKDIRFHDLRHEAISRFFEMGLSLPEVALISGHKEPRMLMRYTHISASSISPKLRS